MYGFRIESGRRGPRGNGRFTRIMDRIVAIDKANRLDVILISGDMSDAGLAVEWAAFLDAVDCHPALAHRMLILPGNHDLNIVDRLNPARLDLPFSPDQTAAADARLVGDRGHSGRKGSGRRPKRGEVSITRLLKRWRRIGNRIAEFAGPRRLAAIRLASAACGTSSSR